MNEQLITLYRFAIGAVERLMADVPDDQLARQVTGADGQPCGNPPGWIVGHLALVNGMALEMLGAESPIPDGWAQEFGPGSAPTPVHGDYPPKEELLGSLRKTTDALAAAAAATDLATLTDTNPIEPLRASLPTTGDLLAHILSTHVAMHAGHLSSWRRQVGHAPLF